VQPVGVVACAGEQLSGDFNADSGQCEQPGRDLRHQRSKLPVGFGDLLIQLQVATGQAPERCLGGLLGVAELLRQTQPGARRDKGRRADVAQLLAQLRRPGGQQAAPQRCKNCVTDR